MSIFVVSLEYDEIGKVPLVAFKSAQEAESYVKARSKNSLVYSIVEIELK